MYDYFRKDFSRIRKGMLKTAGLGYAYQFTHVEGKALTSCMTDQNGPKPYNFRPCKFDTASKIRQAIFVCTYTCQLK